MRPVLRGAILAALLASLIGVAGAATPVRNQYAGVSRKVAVREAVQVSRSWPLPFQDPFATSRNWLVSKVLPQTSSTGAEAWLVLFDALNANEADEACVWVWRAGPALSFEETPSVIWGRPSDPVHERCVSEITANNLLNPEQVVADEETWDVANPQPVTWFGPVSRGSYAGEAIDTSGVSLTAIPARFPNGTSPATSGLSGFVIDDKTWKPVRGATIWIWPSAKSSGRLSTAAPKPPLTAVTTTSDRLGAFSFLDLPNERYGYDIVVRANGYAPLYEVHNLLPPGEMYLGDEALTQQPGFYDQTPYPVANR
jgi:hypothetical protein